MKTIENERFGEERALYNSQDLKLVRCRFEGAEDGESALKESRRITADDCFMDLRYPFWHVEDLKINGGEMTANCRAALWYDNGVAIDNCKMHGIKAVRECKNVSISRSDINSPEFGWRSKNIDIADSSVTGEYAFFESRKITADGLEFQGKYSFQYVEKLKITNSHLVTKDAFWHAEDVIVENSVIEGEYLAWYSENATFVNCRIKGTQPFCYCKNLRLINCTMENCDLSFEYSDVEADIKSHVVSVKNPRSGLITVDSVGEIIMTDNVVYPCNGKVKIRNK